MGEIWKSIPGYEGYYEVSTEGRVRSVARIAVGRWGTCRRQATILTPTPNGKGYLQVRFSIDGKKSKPLVHRLVAAAFVPNPCGLPQINHKDGNKANNCVANLEWCTASENALHRGRVLHKWVGRAKRPVVCTDTGVQYASSHDAARALGLNPGGVFQVCQGRYERTRGLHFEFAGGEMNG